MCCSASTVTSGGRGGSSRGRSCYSAGSLAHDARGCIAATCRSGPPGGTRHRPVADPRQPHRAARRWRAGLPGHARCHRIGAEQRRAGFVHLRRPRHRGAVRRCAEPGSSTAARSTTPKRNSPEH